MVYVALLRGINVGGNNKIAMKDLKVTFGQAGFARVVTYINSGNVVFTDSGRSPADLVAHLEAAILNAHGFPVTVLIRRLADFEILVRALPESWRNDDRQKCDVLFLNDAIDSPGLVEKLDPKPDIDTALYVPGAVIWSVDRDKDLPLCQARLACNGSGLLGALDCLRPLAGCIEPLSGAGLLADGL